MNIVRKAVVSIIVPCYNVELYIDKTINSIIEQTYKNFELILIDDHSNDNTVEIIKKYADYDPRIILLENLGKGVSAARNTGLINATGEFITFIDGDDWVESNYLESLIPYATEDGVVLCGISFEYQNYTKKKIFIAGDWHVAEKNKFLHQGQVCSKIYSRKLIESQMLRFNEQLSIHEDHCFFWDYLISCNHVYFIDKTLYCYRRFGREKSLSARKSNHSMTEWKLASECLLQRIPMLRDKYKFLSASYMCSVVRDLGLLQHFYAVLIMYERHDECTKKIRIDMINDFKELAFLRYAGCFYANRWYTGWVVWCMKHFSANVLDIVLKLFIKER